MNHKTTSIVCALSLLILIVGPELAQAGDLQANLDSVKYKLTVVILPILSVIGMAIAGISFFTGNPNAKQHVLYAILGCVFGFGAQSIVDFIRSSMG